MYTPRQKRSTATRGSAVSAEMTALNTTAPKKAPNPPGTANQQTLPQSTLPNLQWETPEASVVLTSAMCTLAEGERGREPHQQQALGRDPIGHPQSAVDQLGRKADDHRNNQAPHLPKPHFLSHFLYSVHFFVNIVAH
jgi:hypothetical protein